MITRYFYIICLSFSGLVCNISQATEPSNITFAVNAPGSYPYLYFNKSSQRYAGLVADFFQGLSSQGLITINYVDSNQKRSEQFVINGKVDLILANPAWLEQPAKTIASDPIIAHQTFLYSLQAFSSDFSVANLANSRICTHQEFVYTGLTEYFTNNQLQRIDSRTHLAMVSMLEKERCDYAVMNNYNALQAFATPQFCNLPVYQSPQPTSTVNLHFIMRPALQEFRSFVDQQLQQYKDSGKLANSIVRHVGDGTLPIATRCSQS